VEEKHGSDDGGSAGDRTIEGATVSASCPPPDSECAPGKPGEEQKEQHDRKDARLKNKFQEVVMRVVDKVPDEFGRWLLDAIDLDERAEPSSEGKVRDSRLPPDRCPLL
jgi:hypothetical protein